MPNITENESLALVSVAHMKTELRIPASEVDHDALLTRMIHDSANFAAKSTGLVLADMHLLRPAIVSSVRAKYDGLPEIGPRAAHNAWLEPFQDISG